MGKHQRRGGAVVGGVYDFSEEHRHQWSYIGTAHDGKNFFKIYQCTECSCWSKNKLNVTGEEPLAVGDVVSEQRAASANRTTNDDGDTQ